MKKVIIYLLTVVMALSCLAMLPVYASDNLTPDATDVTKWTGWTEYQGGYRKSATATLPDGTEGTVFETGCAPDGTNTYGKINNEYTVTGLEPNTSYVLSATVKVTAPEAAYGSDGFIKGVWSNLGLGIGMAFDGTWQNRFFEKKFDGVWHKYQLGIVTPDSVTNDAEYTIVLGTINGEEYIQNDIYVQLCDMSLVKYELASNLLGRNGSPVFAEVAGNSGEVLLDKWAGWVDYQGGYRKVSYDDEKGTVIEIGNGSETYTYSAYCNNIGLKGFEASKTYVCTVNVKLTGGAYDTNGNATALNGGFVGSGIDFGDGFQGIYFKQENEGKWCTYKFEVNTSDAVSADTMYAFAVGAVNSQYVANDTILLIGETSIVEKKVVNLLKNPTFDKDFTGWSGWSDNCELVNDGHSADGTGAYKSVQIGHWSQNVTLEAGKLYLVSGWIKCSDDFSMNTNGFNGLGIGIDKGEQNWTSFAFAGNVNSNDNLPKDWTYLSTVFAPAETGEYRFSCVNWGPAAGTALFDELCVNEIKAGSEMNLSNVKYKFNTTFDDVEVADSVKAADFGWAYYTDSVMNIKIVEQNGTDHAAMFKQTANGDGTSNLRNWGLGYSANPIVAGFTFSASAVGNDSYMNIYGDGGGSGNAFVKVVKNADGTGYEIKALNGNNTYVTAVSDVEFDKEYSILGIFVKGSTKYILVVNDIVIGLYDYAEAFSGTVATVRFDNIGIDKETVVVDDIFLGTAGLENKEYCNHVTFVDGTKEATCTEEGYTGDVICSECGEIIEEGKVIDKLAHTPAEEKVGAKEATCKEDGYTGDVICSECKEVIEEGKIIDKLAHTPAEEKVGAKEATCKEDGYTGDVICSECKEVIEKGEVIPATGDHVDEDADGYCDVCQEPINVQTSDAAIIVLAVMTVALAATVVFSRKRKED